MKSYFLAFRNHLIPFLVQYLYPSVKRDHLSYLIYLSHIEFIEVHFRVGAFVFIVSVYAIWSLFKHFDERKRAMKRHRFVSLRQNKAHWSSSRHWLKMLVFAGENQVKVYF